MKTKKVRPSLLDRLRGTSDQYSAGGGISLFELRESVQHDLQSLLNTRVRFLSPEKRLGQTHDTIFNYGIPDLTSQQLNSEQGKREFADLIERAVKRFEPRFKSVVVTPITGDSYRERVTFRVDAVLYADPIPEDVSFDSTVDPLTQTISLHESMG